MNSCSKSNNDGLKTRAGYTYSFRSLVKLANVNFERSVIQLSLKSLKEYAAGINKINIGI